MDVLRFITDAYTITIQTTNNQQAWKRFRSRVDSVDEPMASLSYCDYRSSRAGVLMLDDFSHNEPQPIEVTEEKTWASQRPVLFETNSYNFFIEFHDIKGTPRIRHARREITEGFTFYPQSQQKGGILSGHIDFLNEPGTFTLRFEFATEDGRKQEDWLTMEVVSPKLDTKRDLQRIKDVIFEEYDYQIFQYLTTTFTNLHLDRTRKVPNNVVWMAIFKSIFTPYTNAVNFIIHAPNRKAHREVYQERPDKIKRWSPNQENRYGEDLRQKGAEQASRSYYRTEKVTNTTDTVENRFVKFTLDYLGKRMLTVFADIRSKYAKYISDDEIAEMSEYEHKIKQLRQHPFFRSVGNFEGFRQHSAVLQGRSGYSKIYRYWLMLHSSIDMAVGTTSIGLMPIWKLYEIWCFLTMKKMIQHVMEIPDKERATMMEEYPKRAIDMFTNPDANVFVTFRNPAISSEVRLCYQETYSHTAMEDGDGVLLPHTETTEQRPDIVLYVRPSKEDRFRLTYLYDAKYRVKDEKNADVPLEDTLNQMHRYRDAIYFDIDEHERPKGKEVIGGYILFPGRGDKDNVIQQKYYKSIEKVNIGAFPLLPKKDGEPYEVECSLLEEHLYRVIRQQHSYDQIKDSIPQKGLRYEDASDGADVVLVSKIRPDGKQMRWIENHSFLNIPFENIAKMPDAIMASHVIIFDGTTVCAYGVEIGSAECWTKAQLVSHGYDTPRHENYYMIKLTQKEDLLFKGFSSTFFESITLDKDTKQCIMHIRELKRKFVIP